MSRFALALVVSLVLAGLAGFVTSCAGDAANQTLTTTSAPPFRDGSAVPPVAVITPPIVDPALVTDATEEAASVTFDGSDDSSLDAIDASDTAADAPPMPPFDPGPGGTCDRSPGPGDLAIDELMIASVAGSGDDGEWIEVASQRDCALDLIGLHGEAPRGAQVATFDVVDHLWLAARAAFVIADSIDPAINHYLPGIVIGWYGHPGDVLRNMGTSITLTLGGALVDSITYPSLSPTPGTSIAFPADCDAGARSSWALWQPSTASWFPQFLGTPNAPNADIHCR